jgi:hypothetical protein
MHGPSSLLEVHELLALLPHHTGGDVMGAESIAELSPWHLVVRGASGGVVGPPHAGVTTQLLRSQEALLHLRAVSFQSSMSYCRRSSKLNHAFQYNLGWLRRRVRGFERRAWG